MYQRFIIYKITFPDGMIYIGKTTQELDARINRHYRAPTKTPISYAIKCVRKCNLKVEILGMTNHWAKANAMETNAIRRFNSNHINYGYNRTRGGFYDQYDRKIRPKRIKRTGRVSTRNGYHNGTYT